MVSICVVLIIGGITAALWWKWHHTVVPYGTSSQPITYSTDTPSEVKPTTKNYVWQGTASEPKRILLPTINTDGYIQKVANDQHNNVAVPNNIYLAAWYTESVLPGKPGLSIIDGHVTGVHGPGVFKNIGSLKQNDTFSVELGNGTILHYRILKVDNVPADQANSYLFSQDPKTKSQLNLITCGGPFNNAKNAYENRVIVAAALL